MQPYYSLPRCCLRNVRQLLYPRRCPFCNRVLGSLPECPDCKPQREALLRSPSFRLKKEQHYLRNLERAAAPFCYEGCVQQGILRAKYAGEPWIAAEFGVWMARLLTGCTVTMAGAVPVPQPIPVFHLEYDCIVPVPPSGRARGYNVPTLLAIPLAQAMDLPLETDVLCRVRSGQRQAGLSLKERLVNVAGAFCVRDRDTVENRRILLVDDVITTGATISACAQALLSAGARNVSAFSLATVEFSSEPSQYEPIREEEEDSGFEDG